MGSVKLETRNEGRGLREWDYVPLSEPRIVAKQITERSKQDEALYPSQEYTSNPLLSNGAFPFSEPILVTYLDQDKQIEDAHLTKSEHNVVMWLMQGYSGTDIAEHCNTSKPNITILFMRAVEKIVAKNNANWHEVYDEVYDV